MAAKVILVTGGNTGLGLEIVKSLCRSSSSYNILIGCRSLSKGTSAKDEVQKEYPSTSSTISIVQLDLASNESLKEAVDSISAKQGRLDILVNNDIETGTYSIRDGWNKSWDTNVTGTHILTTFSIPLLLKSTDARLLFLSSGTATLAGTENMSSEIMRRINGSPPAGWPKEPSMNPITSYRSSKTGLNMLMREWTRILKNDGVKVWGVSPGFLATNLNGFTVEQLKKIGARDASLGGDFTVEVIEGKRDQDTGKVVGKDMIQPW